MLDSSRQDDDTRDLRIVNSDGEPAHEYTEAVSLYQERSEQALLGLILMDAEMPPRFYEALLEVVTARLGTDGLVFSRTMYSHIYAAMLAVAGRGLAPTSELVDAEMHRRNVLGYRVGDIYELVTIATLAAQDGAPDRARIEGLCQNVLDAAGRRQFMAIAQRIMEHSAGGTPVAEIAEHIGKAVEQVRRPTIGADTTIAAVGDAYMQQLADWRAHPFALRGTTSGLANIDRVTHGWRRGKLLVLAARMSVGKTALALFFARAAAMDIMRRTDGGHEHQVGIISLEMSNEDLFHRLIAAQAGVDAERLLAGDPDLDWDAIDEAGATLQTMPIRMVDAQGAANRVNGQGGQMTVAHIREHALAWHRQGMLDLLIVDFLTLITPPKELRSSKNREEQVAHNIQALKRLAAELDIPVMVLAQLNRENEHGGAAIPQLHHLRDSDVIGQVADVAMFPVRWDYYRERGNTVPDAVRNRPKGYTELYLQKHRGGRVGAIALYSDMASNRFWDWNERRNVPLDADGRVPMGWKPEYWPE